MAAIKALAARYEDVLGYIWQRQDGNVLAGTCEHVVLFTAGVLSNAFEIPARSFTLTSCKTMQAGLATGTFDTNSTEN